MTGGFGAENFGDLLGQLQRLQEGLESAAGSGEEIEGSSGGGAVRVRLRSDLTFTSVSIDPSVVDRDDVALLEDLVLAALHDVVNAFTLARQSQVSDVMNSALSGMLGGAPPAGAASPDEITRPDEAGD